MKWAALSSVVWLTAASVAAQPSDSDESGVDGSASSDGVSQPSQQGASTPSRIAPRPWSIGTAYTLPERRVETGVFQPLRYGLTESVELSTHPLVALLMPNLAVKKAWLRLGSWQLGSRHNLMYPTGLLKLVAAEGTGGIIPYETHVPHIVALANEALLSRRLWRAHVLTARVGAMVAGSFGRSTLRSIELPLVFHRTAAYRDGYAFDVGVDLDGELPGPFAYSVDIDLFVLPARDAFFALEHSGLLTWRATSHFVVQAGYKLIFAAYPGKTYPPEAFRTAWHILPMVDAQWAFD